MAPLSRSPPERATPERTTSDVSHKSIDPQITKSSSSSLSTTRWKQLLVILLGVCFVLLNLHQNGEWIGLSSDAATTTEEAIVNTTTTTHQEEETTTTIPFPIGIEQGNHHSPNPFKFYRRRRFYDAFVAPPVPKTNFEYELLQEETTNTSFGIYIVMVTLGNLGNTPDAKCRFDQDNSTSPFEFKMLGEVFQCQVPTSIAEQIQKHDQHLSLTLETNDGKESVQISAALWPYHNRHNHYQVAVNNMNKDVTCGRNAPKSHCFHDWILWHRHLGVQHFFSYDNLSHKDHPWLEAAQTYMDKGILTLIDWPYHLGGKGNNQAQRVSMNHAMFAVASRVQWLGYFDVDEFLLPLGLLLEGNPKDSGNATGSAIYQHQAADLLNTFAQTVANDTTAYLGLQVGMRNAQHPDYCYQNRKELDNFDNRTVRLRRCVAIEQGDYEIRPRHPKVFVRVGRNGPRVIKSPHMIHNFTMARANNLEFLHFSKKYGCQNVTDTGCAKVETLADSKEVYHLEQQLSLVDQDLIGACEITKQTPCF